MEYYWDRISECIRKHDGGRATEIKSPPSFHYFDYEWGSTIYALNLAYEAGRNDQALDVPAEDTLEEQYDSGYIDGSESGFQMGYDEGYDRGYEAGEDITRL